MRRMMGRSGDGEAGRMYKILGAKKNAGME